LCWNCKIICLGIWARFSFFSQAVIPGNCNLVLYDYSETMRSGTAPLLVVCMKSTQLYWNRKWTAAVVYTRACTQAHMKTLTQTLTVTEITSAGFTNTENKDCNLHLSCLEMGKRCLAGVEHCCFDIKKIICHTFCHTNVVKCKKSVRKRPAP